MRLKTYLPKNRTFYPNKKGNLKSFAPNGDYTILPNPAEDPIVCNNIAWQEFDYTEDMSDGEGDYLKY